MGDAGEAAEGQVQGLLSRMTLAEKIGQMTQVNGDDGRVSAPLAERIRAGGVGSILNEVDPNTLRTLQQIAVKESRLGIPLIFGRDVIHGFRTILPIPLGQAASWNPDVVRAGARLAAVEAASVGLHWTFAPMVDISRDPRWGRVAECLGEDPYLAGVLAAAMVEGFQGTEGGAEPLLAACAKHFAGYGASESGKDYNTTNIPENELRNVYLRPFKAAVEAGVMTLMTSFSDLDGVPATGNAFLLKEVLREEWRFDGFVVSDWDSVRQLAVHGMTEDDRESAFEAVTAGLDMEMAGGAYAEHLAAMVEAGLVPMSVIDERVRAILRIKSRLGLIGPDGMRSTPSVDTSVALQTARTAAVESIVLLKNDNKVLPLDANRLQSLALIGPMADDGYEQLGTWIFDGDSSLSVTPRQAVAERLGDRVRQTYVRALETTRSRDAAFDEATAAAEDADAALLFLGEESILSGEAHCRANIDLPGAQVELIKRLKGTGTPVIAVVMAGRPLTLTNVIDEVDALVYAWHPGSMGGPAIADVVFGFECPRGKLPMSFPRVVGQVPVYYNHKNTGRPASPQTVVSMDTIEARAPQTSFGMTSFHLDVEPTPLFPFGFGLSYADFEYSDLSVSASEIEMGETVAVSATVANVGAVGGVEVVQLYVRDVVGSTTRPVRELKGFRRVELAPGQSARVEFVLTPDDVAFYGRSQRLATEPGEFQVWVGGSAQADLTASFRIRGSTHHRL